MDSNKLEAKIINRLAAGTFQSFDFTPEIVNLSENSPEKAYALALRAMIRERYLNDLTGAATDYQDAIDSGVENPQWQRRLNNVRERIKIEQARNR